MSSRINYPFGKGGVSSFTKLKHYCVCQRQISKRQKLCKFCKAKEKQNGN